MLKTYPQWQQLGSRNSKGVLELLNINDQTPLEISTDGTSLIVSPLRDKKRRQLFHEAVKKTNIRYGHALRRLAD